MFLRPGLATNSPQQAIHYYCDIYILGAAEGISNHRLARQLGVTRPTVLLWRQRYAQVGIPGLLRDAPRPGRRKRIRRGTFHSLTELNRAISEYLRENNRNPRPFIGWRPLHAS